VRVTTWAEYGLIVSLHLARHQGEVPVPARDVASAEGLPGDYVEQILLKLRRAGLVTSIRGAKGGYRLARPAETVSVRDVIEAAENHTFEVNCDAHPVSAERCHPNSACAIRPVWRALQQQIDALLDGISLGDLLAEESAVEELVSIGVAPRS